MNLTLEELLNQLLELADKHGGSIPTNVEAVVYQSGSKGDSHPEVVAIVTDVAE